MNIKGNEGMAYLTGMAYHVKGFNSKFSDHPDTTTIRP